MARQPCIRELQISCKALKVRIPFLCSSWNFCVVAFSIQLHCVRKATRFFCSSIYGVFLSLTFPLTWCFCFIIALDWTWVWPDSRHNNVLQITWLLVRPNEFNLITSHRAFELQIVKSIGTVWRQTRYMSRSIPLNYMLINNHQESSWGKNSSSRMDLNDMRAKEKKKVWILKLSK